MSIIKTKPQIIKPQSPNKSSQDFQSSNTKMILLDINNNEILNNLQKGKQFENIFLVREKITKKQYTSQTFDITYNRNQQKIFLQKMSDLIYVNHPTIVQYHGISFKDFTGNDKLTIFSEYIQSVPLSKILNENSVNHSIFDNTKKQKILIGIARGMMILHEHNIIHGNLNPDEILIDNNWKN